MFEPIFFIFLLDDLFKVYLNQILKYLKYFYSQYILIINFSSIQFNTYY